MDNLQEIAIYLAAIIDGEGYIQLSRQNRAKGLVRLKAAINIANTDTRIIERIRWAYDKLGIPYRVYESSRNVKKGGQVDYQIQIHRLTAVKRVLELILTSAFLGKRNESELLLEFVNGRLGPDGEPWKRGGTGAIRSVPYVERDFEIYRAIGTYGSHKFRDPQRAYALQPETVEDVLWPSGKPEEMLRNEASLFA